MVTFENEGADSSILLEDTSGNTHTIMANCLVGNSTLYPKSCLRSLASSPIRLPDSPKEVVVEPCSKNSGQLKFYPMLHVYEYLLVHIVFSIIESPLLSQVRNTIHDSKQIEPPEAKKKKKKSKKVL